ncbi:MAG: cobyrinate a,c-diamide synthase [Pseudomonadota bacterium]
MPSFIVAAPTSGAGKTMVTAALIAALRARGHEIEPAKVGPDYIDPAFLAVAAGRDAINIDLWAMRQALVGALTASDHLVVEGVMGLFDGPSSGKGSTADVAKALDLPVVLVVDASRQSHSVGALIHGFATFDTSVRVAGVLFNRVASARHEAMLRDGAARAGVPVFGAIGRDDDLAVAERHLGLVQAREHADLAERLANAAARIAETVDLAALEALHREGTGNMSRATPALAPLGQRIAVASDPAFAFAYPHVLAGWRAAGAELLPFSPLGDEAPDPSADAVYLPGGYPELHAGALATAKAWKEGMSAAAARGAVIYGECGGYMALGQSLTDADGVGHAMVGLLPHATSFAVRRRTLGYRRLRSLTPLLPPILRGHEFHRATLTGAEGVPVFEAADTAGAPLAPMGSQAGSVFGSFAHLIDHAADGTGQDS